MQGDRQDLIFVFVLWILGFALAIAFITDGIVYLTGSHRVQRRMDHLELGRDLYRGVGVIEIIGGLGLVFSALSSHPSSWPSLFSSSTLVWLGIPSVLALVAVKVVVILIHRDANDPLSEYSSAITLIILCAGYLIAFVARQLVAA